jgi:geranylgeranyl pyrophosphate synthase
MDLEQAVIATDTLMYEVVNSDIDVLRDASRHIITAGGKRIRPRLLYLSYRILGGADLESIVPLAAAVELVHTATLVHDDINDHGRTRRGRATVNEKWGTTFALLTGDYLFTQVYSLMAPFKDLNKILAEATVALVEGETLQAAAAKNKTLNRDIYQQIVAKKTASLFRAAGLLGASAATRESPMVEILGDFGFYLGLTFQIIDDLLDLTGDTQQVGKDLGVDLTQGKGVGSVYAGENGNGNNGAATLILEAVDDDPFLPIKRQLIEGGAIEVGQQMAQLTSQQAYDCLRKLPASDSVSALADLVDQVLERSN